MHRQATIDTLRQRVQHAASQCVACGLCLPYCPTYRLTTSEAQSPRGRIAMLAAAARNDLAIDRPLQETLGHCLVCRSCEKHCPSGVRFGALMDQGRALITLSLRQISLRELSLKIIDFSLRNAKLLQRLGNLASRIGQRLAVAPGGGHKASPASLTWRLRSYAGFLQHHAGWPSHSDPPAASPVRGRVSLFLGCVARSLDSKTLQDSLRLLHQFGFAVDIPPGQGCCGALPLHAGRLVAAQQLMQQNLDAFDAFVDQPILFTASGCGAALCDYPSHHATGRGLPVPSLEICQFLDQHWPDEVVPTPQHSRVLLHTPCSLANSLPDPQAARRLLSRIPGLDLHDAAGGYGCCGAAGSHMFSDPATAAGLRAPIIAQAGSLRPDVIVTSNIGCALHLAEGLRAAGLDIPVLHPVSVLTSTLPDGEPESC